MIIWNGVQSAYSIVVCARSDVSLSTLTLTVPGETPIPLVSDHTVDDGVVRFDVTGLSPNTLYEYTISSDDSEDDESGSVRTFPLSGPIKIISCSCDSNTDVMMGRAMAREDAHIVVHTGDETYQESVRWPTLTDALDQDAHYFTKRYGRSQRMRRWLYTQGLGYGIVVDDHDFFYNDAVDDLDDVRTYTTGWDASYAAMDATDWTNIKANASQAIKAYSKGNPVNTDPDAETDAFYFRFEAGDFEVFVLSQVASSPTRMRGVYGTDLLGTAQELWLKNQLQASTKPHKLICSPKATLTNFQANPDTWNKYDDLYPLLDWVSNTSGVTGVMWIGGDFHSAGMFASKVDALPGATYSAQDQVRNTADLDFDHLSFIASGVGKYGADEFDYGKIRCDVRDSNEDGGPDKNAALYAISLDNGLTGEQLAVRERVVFGTAESFGNGFVTGKMVNQVSEVIAEATQKFDSNTIYEGRAMPTTQGFIGLDPSNSDITEALQLNNILLDVAESTVRNKPDDLPPYLAQTGDYIDQLGAWAETSSGVADRQIHVAIYETESLLTIIPTVGPIAEALIDIPGDFNTGVGGELSVSGLNVPLTAGKYYTAVVASPSGGSVKFGDADASAVFVGSNASRNVTYDGATETYPSPWVEDSAAAGRAIVTWGRVVNDNAANPPVLDTPVSNQTPTVGDGVSIELTDSWTNPSTSTTTYLRFTVDTLPPGIELIGTKLVGQVTEPGSYTTVVSAYNDSTDAAAVPTDSFDWTITEDYLAYIDIILSPDDSATPKQSELRRAFIRLFDLLP